MAEPVIKIGYGDWLAEYVDDEPDVSSRERLVEACKGAHTAKVARWALVARERGDAPGDLLKPNKLLLQCAAQADIAGVMGAQRERIELENGRSVRVRSFVGPVPVEEGEGEEDKGQFESAVGDLSASRAESRFYVDALSEEGHQRALRYLERQVPGYVYNRLKEVAANRGDVRGAAGQLVERIWAMVEGLE